MIVRCLSFRIHGLAGGDGHHLVDVIYRTATAEVVDRTGNTLKNGTKGLGTAKTLHHLVGNVAYLKTREYQYVGFACNVAAGSLLLSD